MKTGKHIKPIKQTPWLKKRKLLDCSTIFVDYGENIHLGRNVTINMICVFLDCNLFTIGDSCGIGPGTHIYTVYHPVNPEERLPQNSILWKSLTAPVTLGRNVWIGRGSIILPGVTIGAGSVVTK